MQERPAAERKPDRGHPVHVDPRARRLERPALVRHDRRDQATVPLGEKPVALDQEVLQGAGFGMGRGARGLVARCEAGVATGAEVMNALPVAQRRHVRKPVRKAVERPPGRDEERARGVEAQKPHAWHAADADVRADVQLGDRTESELARRRRRPCSEHAKRDDRRPCLPSVEVRLDPGWQTSRERPCINGPVCEEEVAPALGQEPRGFRRR